MPTLAANQSLSVNLPAGQILRFDTVGQGIVTLANREQVEVGKDQIDIGPFAFAHTLSISAQSTVRWNQYDADNLPTNEGSIVVKTADPSQSAKVQAYAASPAVYNGGFRICGVVGASVEASALRSTLLKIEAESPFDAVRITICTRHTASSANWTAVVAPTATAARTNSSTLFRPTQDGSTFVTALASAGAPFGWRSVTFNGASTGTVPAAASALLPAYLQSDWIACSSVPRIDGGTRPLAMVRIFHNGTVDGSHSIMQGLQPSGGYADQSAKPWYREWQAGASTSVNMVSNLATEPSSLAGSAFWVHVEFAYRGVVAKTVIGVGDSIMESNGTQLPGNVYGAYGFRGCALASTPSAPVQWINSGMSSQSSATYFAAGRMAFDQFKPTHVLYAAYSPNDAAQPGKFETDAMRQRVLQMLEICQAQNIRVMLVTGVPNENHTLASDNARKDFNNWVRQLCATGAATLVDYGAAVGDGASPEKFVPQYRFDAVHPNDAGMDIGGQLVAEALSKLP